MIMKLGRGGKRRVGVEYVPAHSRQRDESVV